MTAETMERTRLLAVGFRPKGAEIWTLYLKARKARDEMVASRGTGEHYALTNRYAEAEGDLREAIRAID